jgi:hypothetical protein
MTLDEFAQIAALKLAQMYFPAKTDEESLQMLRMYTDILRISTGAPSVDEQHNCVEG